MDNGEILIYPNNAIKSNEITVIRKFRTTVNNNLILKLERIKKNDTMLKSVYQYIISLQMLNVNKMFGKSKISRIFASNNTCHASHKNSAPGRVFALYRLLVSNSLNSKAYVVQ
jgi:hypothetical protein